jgi:hypothetical protein
MKSVFIGNFLIPPFSLFFQKPINDFLNYEKKLILAGLKESWNCDISPQPGRIPPGREKAGTLNN